MVDIRPFSYETHDSDLLMLFTIFYDIIVIVIFVPEFWYRTYILEYWNIIIGLVWSAVS